MNLLSIWDQVQPSIKEELGASTYETWFSSLNIKEKDGTTLTIETPDEFFKNWIIEHYLPVIDHQLKNTGIPDIKIEFVVLSAPVEPSQPPRILPVPAFKKRGGNLNPRFSFENFVIGPSNRFAFAACQAVAESPAKAYNPLFIYSPVGLGKTHLMQAVTLEIQRRHPDIKHFYISSERFTNELIEAIRHRSTNQFRNKYRNIDVLLIDDIHFIAGKESTQEEFFHTFNALHNNRKQIIISSDRPPKEINNLEDRLVSRFAWGLITEIQPPDFETRVAILRKKIEREPVKVPDDVIYFIAEQIKTNIRELEGALIRVVAYSLLEENVVSLNMAKTVLKDMVKETIRVISIDKIQKEVGEYFRVSVGDLKAKRRNRNIILPRQIAMYISRKLTNSSFPEIGSAFGGKDHTTVLHACKKIEKQSQMDKGLQQQIETITQVLTQ